MIENRFEEISALFKKSYIDEFWLAQKPWLRNPDHRYKAFIGIFIERPKNNYLYRGYTWVDAFGPTAQTAMDNLAIKVYHRLPTLPKFVFRKGVL